jgi:hypothetical protein
MAIQSDMPESAIASMCIDLILSPEAIAQEIVRIAYRQICTFSAPNHHSGQRIESWMALYTCGRGASMRQIVSK